MKQVGIFAGQGAVIGLDTMSRAVENSAFKMGKNAIKSLSEVMSDVANIVGQDIDTAPTIRPVIDLTDINHGADRISEIFSRRMRMNLDLSGAIETGNAIKNANRSHQERIISARQEQSFEIHNHFDMTGMVVREDGDIDRIATQLHQKQQGALRGRGGQNIIRRR